MPRRRVGVSWIGGRDRGCFAAALTETRRARLFTKPHSDKEAHGTLPS